MRSASMTSLAAWLDALPLWPVLLLGRWAVAAVFWISGQTKIEGFVFDPVHLDFALGWPQLAAGAVDLFRDEYQLPLLAPMTAAVLAALAEHVLPAMLVLGLGTRFAAAGLLGMTLVIQLLVYPGAYPTHGTWAAVLLLLILRGPGPVSLDHRLAGAFRAQPRAA